MNTKTITIQKDSQLISIYASGELTATQKKIYNCLIYMAKQMLQEDSNRHIFHIAMQDLMDCISLDSKKLNYVQIVDNIKAIKEIRVEYNTLGKNKKTHISIFNLLGGIDVKDGIIEFNFDFQVLRLIQKPESYAYLDLRVMKGLDTKHSISLYEILQDYKNLKVVDLELDKFKKAMDIKETEYKRLDDFRRRVIDPSIAEINEKTDLNISYEKITRGRKVTGLKFVIKESKAKQEQNNQLGSRQAFIDFVRNNHINTTLWEVKEEFTDSIVNIKCSEKGLLYDYNANLTFEKEKADRIWSKLYELYKEQKMPWQKDKDNG